MSLCNGTNRLPGLRIVVEEGELMGAFMAEDAGHRQGYQSYQEKISMGHSIGVEARGGGTLGGSVLRPG